MTNEELILQMLTDIKLSFTELDDKLSGRISNLDDKLSQRIEDNTGLINLKIENDVTKRIELLFDGYKLTNEKLRETDRGVDELEKRVEKLEIKAG